VRAALTASGLGLPPKRITINLAPADLPKEGNLLNGNSRITMDI
jgi:magnesium chelatase family protein